MLALLLFITTIFPNDAVDTLYLQKIKVYSGFSYDFPTKEIPLLYLDYYYAPAKFFYDSILPAYFDTSYFDDSTQEWVRYKIQREPVLYIIPLDMKEDTFLTIGIKLSIPLVRNPKTIYLKLPTGLRGYAQIPSKYQRGWFIVRDTLLTPEKEK